MAKVYGHVTAKGVDALGAASLGYSNVEETIVQKVIEPGFSKLPTQKVTPYCPPNYNVEVVYITIKHTDSEGEEFILCENLPRW